MRAGVKFGPVLAILLGAAITLGARGYQFGQSNDAVYLVDAIRRSEPGALAKDWWASSTFQYNGAFSVVTARLMRWGMIRPAFAAGYIGLALMLHWAWWRLVRRMNGNSAAYLTSVAIFYLMAGGLGLGMYEFLQDRAFLPSNIAAVAFLWGVVLWAEGNWIGAGIAVGIAGLVHLNYAVVAMGMWGLFSIAGRRNWKWIIATAVVLAGCCIDLWPAMGAMRSGGAAMGLGEFVQVYVKLRHPHHYDVKSWPILLWLSFFAPMIVWWLFKREMPMPRRVMVVFWAIMGLLGVALLGAGIWYWSERLVQMSLWRFSIFPKLIGCIGAGIVLQQRWRRFSLVLIGIVIGGAAAWAALGHEPFVRNDDADYVKLCAWAREKTPLDCIFLVPPDELSMRTVGRRAIVVNYKGVPQLASELPEWRRRMEAVLRMNILDLPRRMDRTMDAIGARYDALDQEELLAGARAYGAQYVVARKELKLKQVHQEGSWRVYRVP